MLLHLSYVEGPIPRAAHPVVDIGRLKSFLGNPTQNYNTQVPDKLRCSSKGCFRARDGENSVCTFSRQFLDAGFDILGGKVDEGLRSGASTLASRAIMMLLRMYRLESPRIPPPSMILVGEDLQPYPPWLVIDMHKLCTQLIAAARDLLEVLGYIPLAISQAAAYMRRNKITIEKYLKALKYSDFNLVDHLTTELVDPRRQQGTPSSVFLTWKLSFDQISKEEPRAAEILSLMAFLDGQGIPEGVSPRREGRY
ncbi:MAG: hypothetical protein M1840_006253 [Geoglossum simile]|nr:MAG: hypothetical protein M1840_006253 [Geoglossum simile]